jgi:hypothetical protein
MTVRSTHERDAIRSDRRWLLAWAGVFVASVLLIIGGWVVYRATGPHPQIRTFIRQLKHEARWLVPFLKRRPAKWYSLRDDGDATTALAGLRSAARHGHAYARASGHAPQRG